jgi:hypothetical protein
MGLNLKESKALPAIGMFKSGYHHFFFSPIFYKVLIGSFGENVPTISVVSHGIALNIGVEWKRREMVGRLLSRSARNFMLTYHSS